MNMIIVMMVMAVDAMRERTPQPPHGVRNAEADQKQSGDRHHLLAKRFEELRAKHQRENTEKNRHRHMAKAAHEGDSRRPGPRPAPGACHRRDRNPVVRRQRMQ